MKQTNERTIMSLLARLVPMMMMMMMMMGRDNDDEAS